MKGETVSETERTSLLHRIERLERTNRNWRRLAASAAFIVLCTVSAWAVGQQPPGKQPDKNPDQPRPGGQLLVRSPAENPIYANFFQLHTTPEEVTLEYGLNRYAKPGSKEPIVLKHELVVSWYTAKRLSLTLTAAVQQYERTYGKLELDFQKRAKPSGGFPDAD
jgi:hypothetical protein